MIVTNCYILTRVGGIFSYLSPPPISYDDFIISNKLCYKLLHIITTFFLTSLSSPCYILLHLITNHYILLQLWIKKWADGKGVNQNHQPYVVVGRKEESPTHLCKRISEERTNSDGYYINGYRIPYDGSSHFIDSACPPRMTGFITIRIIVLCINTFTMYGGANIRAFC